MSDMLTRLAARAQESPVVLGKRIGYRFAPSAEHQEAWPGEEAWFGEQMIARPNGPMPAEIGSGDALAAAVTRPAARQAMQVEPAPEAVGTWPTEPASL
ncbi:MAG TPA: hypothetical protein VN029_10815, partial [Sphingomonas sp.]|nr:hypothetical protein [Sphingomonas sp.]